jgi:NACalpha-BTF3-like transcription factor
VHVARHVHGAAVRARARRILQGAAQPDVYVYELQHWDDISRVVNQCGAACSRTRATRALRACNGDVVDAIVSLHR